MIYPKRTWRQQLCISCIVSNMGDDGTVGIKGYHVYSNICCIFYILYKTDNESGRILEQ